MKKIISLSIFLFMFFIAVDQVSAQSAYITHDYSYTEKDWGKVACGWDKIRTIYKCANIDNVCVDGAVAGYLPCNGKDCKKGDAYASLFKDDCGQGKYWCDNLPRYTVWTYGWVNVQKTGDRCHYVSSINSYGGCSYDTGTQCANSVNWDTWERKGSISSSECDNSVNLCRNCGVCEPTSANLTFATAADITSAPLSQVCKWGSLQNLSFPIYGENWNWNCVRDGVPSGTCSAKNNYIDIGLRIKDANAPGGVIKIGVEEKTCYSPYRIHKEGKTWCIGLLPGTATTHPRASDARINTVNGVKIIRQVP